MGSAAFSPQDVKIVRGLASQVMELALSEEYETRRKRWRDVNERRKPDRAPVWCRPAGVWREILPEDALNCTDPECRSVEYALRQHLYKDWVGDDHIVEPWWPVSAAWDCDSQYMWGLRTGHLTGSTGMGGFHYEPPIKSIDDYENITVPTFTYNEKASDDGVSRMAELFGDVMPIRLYCQPAAGPILGTYLEQLRGMAPMMDDLAFHPHVVHRAMAKLTAGVFEALRAAEATGKLNSNHHEPMFCSDPVNGYAPGEPAALRNLWVAANSQEFDQVSPRMQDEFLFNYQIPLFQQYGAVCYGCCENLTHKIQGVLRIPNLRIFVCSAWSDLNKIIEATANRQTIMWRQSAAVVIYEDMAVIRDQMELGARKLQGHYYQIVLREMETLGGNPTRIRDWAHAAIETAEKYA